MTQQQSGSFTLFRVAGITVFVHWSWFLVAYIAFQFRASSYTAPVWNVVEYLSLFAIVLLHEFGHALACRQVGGSADCIVLWPLGGIAYVAPPPRPGAWLWSIAAGPLVNVFLVPVTLLLYLVGWSAGWPDQFPDLHHFLVILVCINIGLLVFNMLPIYPLDGGQILQALLWFAVGRATSLKIVSVIGLAGGLGLILLAVALGDPWLIVMAGFLTLRAWAGFGQARVLQEIAALPRHPGLACPSCGDAPPQGEFWQCAQCKQPFDMIVHQAVCPQCGTQFEKTACPNCHQHHPLANWQRLSVSTAGESRTP